MRITLKELVDYLKVDALQGNSGIQTDGYLITHTLEEPIDLIDLTSIKDVPVVVPVGACSYDVITLRQIIE
jgi:hypothetical protein